MTIVTHRVSTIVTIGCDYCDSVSLYIDTVTVTVENRMNGYRHQYIGGET